MADKKEPAGDYEVGYSRPPKNRQFKKGRSGNPNGRPKSPDSGSIDIPALLDEPVKAKIGGQAREISPFEASVRQLAKRACGGDLRAIITFLKLCERYGVMTPPPPEHVGGVICVPYGYDYDEWLEIFFSGEAGR